MAFNLVLVLPWVYGRVVVVLAVAVGVERATQDERVERGHVQRRAQVLVGCAGPQHRGRVLERLGRVGQVQDLRGGRERERERSDAIADQIKHGL